MSRINFNSCEIVADIERLHGEVLPGKMLLEIDETITWVNGKPTCNISRLPIFGVYASEHTVAFEIEKVINKRELIAFPAGQIVVTSVAEVGDIFWGIEDGDNLQYSIDDLTENDVDFDGLLRSARDISQSMSIPL